MDTLALTCTFEVLNTGSIRGAARTLDRAPASVSAALDRVEAELATRLVEKAGTQLSVTLEGRRLLEAFRQASKACKQLRDFSEAWGGTATGNPTFSISLLALSRFTQIALSGSIRSASRDLEVGQPQLSRQMSNLEADLGTKLFIRTSNGIAVTNEGTQVLSIAEELESFWKRLSRMSDSRFRRSISTCRLGTIIPVGHESDTAIRLADLAARWLIELPQSPLFISSTTAEQLLKGLKDGTFDVALLDTEAVPVDLQKKSLSSTSLAIVGQQKLFQSDVTDIESLLQERPIAVPSVRSGLRQQFRSYLKSILDDRQRDALTLVDVDSLPIIVNLVLNHGFLAVLPHSSIVNMKAPLSAITLGKEYDMTLTLVWPANVPSERMAHRIIEMF